MSLAEVLPEVRSLSPHEKLRLFQILAEELGLRAESPLLEANATYAIPSPDRGFEAAAVLLKALEAERNQP